MKKSLLALAVLGAVSGAAFAQQSSSVTLYGLVDAAFVHEAGAPGTDASFNKLTSGVKNGSRWGIKGTEDLGGGLAANFVLESGFNVDAGSSAQGGLLFGRQAYVGLTGGFGSVNFGRQYTPAYLALSKIDPFETGFAGRANNLIWDDGVRMNNTVKYDTPADIGGFSASVAYGFGEQADTSNGRQVGASIGYGNGPINVVGAYHNATAGAAVTPSATALGYAPGDTTGKQFLIGGSYDFGVVKANLGFDTEKSDAGIDARNWLVGASVPFGASTVLASYVRHNDRSGAGLDANQVAIGYVYALSKRTNLYTAYARVNNIVPAIDLLNGHSGFIGNGTETGTGNKAFNVGIQHKF